MRTTESIKALRRDLGMTQEELAKRLGVAFATVNRWERGHRKPSKLARRLLTELKKEVAHGEK